MQEPEDGHFKLAETCSLKQILSWKTVIVVLYDIYPIQYYIHDNSKHNGNVSLKYKGQFLLLLQLW
jgi:hypothetical protein